MTETAVDAIICLGIAATDGLDLPAAAGERVVLKEALSEAGSAVSKAMERLSELAKTQAPKLREGVQGLSELIPGKSYLEKQAASDLTAFKENPSVFLQNLALGVRHDLMQTEVNSWDFTSPGMLGLKGLPGFVTQAVPSIGSAFHAIDSVLHPTHSDETEQHPPACSEYSLETTELNPALRAC